MVVAVTPESLRIQQGGSVGGRRLIGRAQIFFFIVLSIYESFLMLYITFTGQGLSMAAGAPVTLLDGLCR